LTSFVLFEFFCGNFSICPPLRLWALSPGLDVCTLANAQEGKRLLSVYPQDLPGLDRLLTSKLRLFGFHPALPREAKSAGHRFAVLP
jgi:hypothetical protein